ncbi:hypothetical protein [Chromohalobacter sp. 48-RD10]|uniref:hypothetical protein n=1 Tax=Chromohalobacter sp. 48-RD10 TaxID=2994063 RepID=UPI0032AF45D3
MADRTWLAEAARVTLASSGAYSPGIDGIGKSTLAPVLDEELTRLQAELLSGDYRPSPARRVTIPKANGELRPLGIPTLRDRIVQRAMLMAMEPTGRAICTATLTASGRSAACIMRSAP